MSILLLLLGEETDCKLLMALSNLQSINLRLLLFCYRDYHYQSQLKYFSQCKKGSRRRILPHQIGDDFIIDLNIIFSFLLLQAINKFLQQTKTIKMKYLLLTAVFIYLIIASSINLCTTIIRQFLLHCHFIPHLTH